MPIELEKETREKIIAALQEWFAEKRDEELGNLEASFLLDFVLTHVGPTVYNQAVKDAQAAIQEKIIDLDGELFQDEPPDPPTWTLRGRVATGWWDGGEGGPARSSAAAQPGPRRSRSHAARMSEHGTPSAPSTAPIARQSRRNSNLKRRDPRV